MGADEEGTLERLKALRRELLDPKSPNNTAAHQDHRRLHLMKGRNYKPTRRRRLHEQVRLDRRIDDRGAAAGCRELMTNM
jgi:hypothetical protein